MTCSMGPSAGCADIEPLLPELALGILSGKERARALAHIESCSRCSADLESLSLTADSVLQVAPEVDPPAGFEVGVLERLGVKPSKRRARFFPRLPSLRVSAIAGAAAAALAALGLGLAQIGGGASAPVAGAAEQPAHMASASLLAAHRSIGDVYVYTGRPSWLFMDIYDAGWSGRVTCEVTTANGTSATVGDAWLTSGYGTWGTPLSRASDRLLRTVRVVTSNGYVLATAHLS